MGYMSDVRIIMGPKAYELMEGNCLKSEETSVKNMILKPHIINKSSKYFAYTEDEGKTEIKHDAVYIGWNYVKWYESFSDVSAVMNTLNQLNDLVEDDSSKLSEYFYKFMKVGEDGISDEITNDDEDEFVGDYYVVTGFSV